MHFATINEKERFEIDDLDWRRPIAQEMKAQGFDKQAERFCQCHKRVILVGCNTQSHEPIRIAMPSRCENRICPVCGKVKSFRIRRKIRAMMKGIPQVKGNRLMLLTLTKKSNGKDGFTKESIKEFFGQVRKFMNRFYPAKSNSGGIVILEIGKDFNLHVHCVVFGPYIHQAVLSKVWNEITGDSKIVDIREIKNHKSATNYITKYVTKNTELEGPKEYVLIIKEMYKLRAMRTYGIFYNFKVLKEPFTCPLCGESFHYQGTFGMVILDQSGMTYKEMKQFFETGEVI